MDENIFCCYLISSVFVELYPSLVQLKLINELILEKWKGATSRVREKLIRLIGQIGTRGLSLIIRSKVLVKSVNSFRNIIY